jgi:predicted Fe-S protein YdhL (DUF1289 family)
MTLTPAPADVASPCINICTLDAANVCVGCGRTIDEIARWSRMTSDERRSVCAQALERCQTRQRSETK